MKRNFSLRVRLFALPAVVLALVVAGQLLFGAFFARSYLIEGKNIKLRHYLLKLQRTILMTPDNSIPCCAVVRI